MLEKTHMSQQSFKSQLLLSIPKSSVVSGLSFFGQRTANMAKINKKYNKPKLRIIN